MLTDADKLQAARAALFPDPKPMVGKPQHSVSSDVVDNLEGVLIDLERTGADAGCIRTLERMMRQLVVARRILNPGK